jgi:AcrR family transcriptional regulator
VPIEMPANIPRPHPRPHLAPAKSRILETANELFYDEGIRSVGIDRLIGASTVTKATFYKHYGSKDRLVTEYVYHRHRLAAEHVWALAEQYDDLEEYMRELLRFALLQITAPGFRGCPFLKAASEYTDPTHPVRRAVEVHREWTNLFVAELLRAAGHPLPGEAADDLTLAVDGAMSGAYAGDPVAATTALQRAFERVMAEAKAAA